MSRPLEGPSPRSLITKRLLGLGLMSLQGCALLETLPPVEEPPASMRPATVSDSRDAEIKAVLAHLMQIAQSRNLEAFKAMIRHPDQKQIDPTEERALMTTLTAHKVRDFRVERNGGDEASLWAEEASGNPDEKAIRLRLALDEGLWKIALPPRPIGDREEAAESHPRVSQALRKGRSRPSSPKNPAKGAAPHLKSPKATL